MEERIILAVDVSEEDQARHLVRMAKNSGARYVKMGLELSTAIRDGADSLVIGRQITKAADPALAYSKLVEELTLAA